MSGFAISPARYRSGGSVDTKPYGTTGWTHVTTYKGWTRASSANPWPFDIAVIKTDDAELGVRTGWQGLAWSVTPFRGTIDTAGYPGVGVCVCVCAVRALLRCCAAALLRCCAAACVWRASARARYRSLPSLPSPPRPSLPPDLSPPHTHAPTQATSPATRRTGARARP